MDIVNSRLEWFVEKMREKLALPRNQAKSDWRNVHPDVILSRIYNELDELQGKYNNAGLLDLSRTPSRDVVDPIILEAADCANYCLMLADLLHALASSTKEGHAETK